MAKRTTVIVTGSTGYIGSALINSSAGRFSLVGLDRAATRQPPPAAECICIDLTSEDSIAAGLQRVRMAYGTRIASVIHLAAYFDLTGEPNPLYDEITGSRHRKAPARAPAVRGRAIRLCEFDAGAQGRQAR